MDARLPSSFRDPEGYVFRDGEKIRRKILTSTGRERMERLLASDFYKTQLAPLVIPTSWKGEDLLHETVPVLTYPYEWSFGMLKDAALGQLEILETCLQNGFILKDGSAFNSLFHKGRMVFVDLLSIDTYQDGQIWEGYHQFCKHFLFPLLLESKKGVAFQPLWRGTADGISLSDMRALLTGRDLFWGAGFKHVFLQSLLARSSGTKKPIKKSSFAKPALLAFVRNLKQTIQKLTPKGGQSVWENYAEENTYETEDRQQKEAFLQKHLASRKLKQIVDLGCNTGHYSQIAASVADRVVAVDYDPVCIEKLYRSPKPTITPMVGNLLNPSPALGWNLEEREDQLTRLASNAFLALALIHHVCITENVPIPFFVELLAKMGTCGVVEWVDKQDPMVQVLLKNRKDIFNTYTWEHFKRCLEKHFKVEATIPLNKGTRTLCFVVRR